MSARIEEYDFGTKAATRRKIQEMQDTAPMKFDRAVYKWWFKVYQTALQECPVDTGALRASIRIQRGETEPQGKFVVGRTADYASTSYYIAAGGGGVINPKHKREVDYAQAVHDGYYTGGTKLATVEGFKTKKSVGIGRWMAGDPFLDRAIQMNEGEFWKIMGEFMDDKQKQWSEDQPPVPSIWTGAVRLVK